MKIESQALREDVKRWLTSRLRYLYAGWDVQVYETHRHKLSRFLEKIGLLEAFPAAEAFDIQVDVTAVLRRGNEARLAFVVCKGGPITLKDVGIMQEYSNVAMPLLSAVLSPSGMSPSLNTLLNAYNRVEVLEYGNGRRLKIGTWDVKRKQVDLPSVVPPGELS